MTGDQTLSGVRVLMVMGGFEMGGTERQVTQLARHLARHEGAAVQVAAFGDLGLAARRLGVDGIPWCLTHNPWRGPRLARPMRLLAFARALRAARPDVILSYTLPPNLACGLVWRRTGAKACIWNQRDAGVHRGRRATERLAVRRVSAFASNSAGGVEFLTDALGVPPGRITLVPNAVELTPGASPLAKSREPTVVMLANLNRTKDYVTLLAAWERVVADPRLDGRPRLVLAGALGDAYDLVRAHAVPALPILLGPVADVAALLADADIAVYSSRSEGCPNGVLEPMAAGLPVVATDTPGIRDALGSDELLAPPGDAETLAEHLVSLLTDPKRRQRVGAANREAIARRPSPKEAYGAMTRLIAAELHSAA